MTTYQYIPLCDKCGQPIDDCQNLALTAVKLLAAIAASATTKQLADKDNNYYAQKLTLQKRVF